MILAVLIVGLLMLAIVLCSPWFWRLVFRARGDNEWYHAIDRHHGAHGPKIP